MSCEIKFGETKLVEFEFVDLLKKEPEIPKKGRGSNFLKVWGTVPWVGQFLKRMALGIFESLGNRSMAETVPQKKRKNFEIVLIP